MFFLPAEPVGTPYIRHFASKNFRVPAVGLSTWLLPEQLANQPAVQLEIGKYLRSCPDPPLPVLTEGDAPKTNRRPKKVTSWAKPKQQGQVWRRGGTLPRAAARPVSQVHC